jgi:outer membrane protein
MKQFFIHTILLLSAATAYGHPSPDTEPDAPRLWTMEECMEYAALHSPAVTQARWDLATAGASEAEAFAEFFPSLSAQVGGQFSWGRNIDPETNTYNNVTTFNNGYGIYASVNLFDGGQTFNRYKLARAEKERSLNNVQMQRDDRAISTMLAYVDAVYYAGAVKIAEDKLDQSRRVLTLTLRQEELGIKGHPDVAQAEATVAGDEYSLVQQRNLLTQSMLNLRSTMNLPSGETLLLDTIPSPMKKGIGAGTDDAETIFSIALLTNPAAKDAGMMVKSEQYRYRTAKSALYPTISLNAGISTSYYKTITGGYTVPAFGEQFRNNRGEYLSATLSIPLFSNLNRLSNVKRAKYALERSRSVKDERLRKLHDDITLAVADRDGYAMEIVALRAKAEADHEAYRLNSRKYEEGLMSLIDCQLSANTYFSSKLELLKKQMLYILKNKLVDYYKGNLSWMSR